MQKTKPDPEWRRKAIKRRLRAIKRDPSSAKPGEVQRLTAEYTRLQQEEKAPKPPTPSTPVGRLTEEEEAAVSTWPPELRARMQQGAMSRVILPWADG
ncbi:hypothetical protein [Streptomyces sp. NPDC005385]|uniref:hypothetical protein n=1 Tax=Streptomyces sp. NPDC005385 TaxID=3157039 RepID=UPI0033A494E9